MAQANSGSMVMKTVRDLSARPALVQPLRDLVYVKILDVLWSDTIIIFERDKRMPVRGKVLSVGAKQKSVKPGVTIQFYFGGMELYYPDRQHGFVSSQNVLAVL